MTIETVVMRGLQCLRLTSGGASVTVSRFGAQVLSWMPADGRERLFVSERAATDGITAIRGGIPVCFPQFSELGQLPKHGLVRTRVWETVDSDGSDRLIMTLRDDAAGQALWPHAFEVRLEVRLAARRLEVGLAVRNTGANGFSFTGALHTYLAVRDIGAVRLSGLEGCEYRDSAGGNAIRRESAPVLVIDREVDRVYHDPPRRLWLDDGNGRLAVESAGFADTVVWNPWRERCAGLPDMVPDGYQRMLCIEAAAARVPVEVMPGGLWQGSQVLTVPD